MAIRSPTRLFNHSKVGRIVPSAHGDVSQIGIQRQPFPTVAAPASKGLRRVRFAEHGAVPEAGIEQYPGAGVHTSGTVCVL